MKVQNSPSLHTAEQNASRNIFADILWRFCDIFDYIFNIFLLYKLQHGSRAKRSTETQLLTFVQDLYKNLRNNKQTDDIAMDFAKAFDKVSHKKLIRKLRE